MTPRPNALPDAHKVNFETLLQAARAGDLCIVQCTDAKTHDPVTAICAVNRDAENNIELAPIARFFNGNPYEQLIPPSVD